MNRQQVPWIMVLRALAGGVLLFAAALKAWELVQTPRTLDAAGWSEVFPLLLIGFEIAAAGWMWSGLWPRFTRWFGAGLFAAFAAVAATKVAQGASSCGCFGRVEVNPWVTLVLDIGLCLAFVAVRPNRESQRLSSGATGSGFGGGPESGGRGGLILASFLLLAFVGVWAAQAARPAGVDPSQAAITTQNGLLILEPQRWVGESFPLFDYLDNPDPLRQGSWWVMLYSHSCGHCRETIPKLEAVVRQGQPVALISIPPHADPRKTDPVLPGGGMIGLRDQLSADHEWFAQTPVLLELRGGRVIRAAEGEGSDTWF